MNSVRLKKARHSFSFLPSQCNIDYKDLISSRSYQTVNFLKDFWQVELDVLHNFPFYFKEFNSSRLKHFKLRNNKRNDRDYIFGKNKLFTTGSSS
jgi:hypothetical protein